MTKNFRGEAIYTAEQDIHFPALTVGETLAFASEARSVSGPPDTMTFRLGTKLIVVGFRFQHKHPPPGLTRKEFAHHTRDVILSVLGIAHTINTRVGNEYVRGVSGGE